MQAQRVLQQMIPDPEACPTVKKSPSAELQEPESPPERVSPGDTDFPTAWEAGLGAEHPSASAVSSVSESAQVSAWQTAVASVQETVQQSRPESQSAQPSKQPDRPELQSVRATERLSQPVP